MMRTSTNSDAIFVTDVPFGITCSGRLACFTNDSDFTGRCCEALFFDFESLPRFFFRAMLWRPIVILYGNCAVE